MGTKTVLITGSTSGIGKAIAIAFAERGYNLVFNGLEQDGAKIARDVVAKHNNPYFFSPANMLDVPALRQMVENATSKFGGVDVLVNNAGVQHVSPIESFPDNEWERIIGVNLSAAFYLAKAVWPGMKERRFGRMINIASAHALVASPYKSAYVAAKHGLVGFTKTAALEGAAVGITCNAICPGYVKTPLVEQQVSDQARVHGLPESEVIEKVILSNHAIKAFIPAETIAALCLFLASDDAATITGTAIPTDAGWSAH